MIKIKTSKQVNNIREGGKVLAEIFNIIQDKMKEGIATQELDELVENTILKHNMSPSFKGYNGFPASACISINDEVVHGIPTSDRFIKNGDIVSVDIGATYNGYVSDAARTFFVGEISDDARRLIETAEASFFEGIKFAVEGNRLSDISHAIQKKVESENFGVIREFVGHGIGEDMHEDPKIPNYGDPGKGPYLKQGMCLAIEPMITAGSYRIKMLDDGWTVVTSDGSLSAHYENTIVITDSEPIILTI